MDRDYNHVPIHFPCHTPRLWVTYGHIVYGRRISVIMYTAYCPHSTLTWHSTQSQEERSNWRKFPLIKLNNNNNIKWRPRAWIWPAKCLCHIGGKAFLGFGYQLSGRDGLIKSQHRLVAFQKAKINLLTCFLGHKFSIRGKNNVCFSHYSFIVIQQFIAFSSVTYLQYSLRWVH